MAASPEVERIPLLPGDSEMARRMREFDWSATGVGPVEQWPQVLRTSVSTCLECAFPFVVSWGPDLIIFYNDEYQSVLGAKHPAALGERASVVWAEIWDVIGPMLSQVMQEGKTTRSRDLLLHMGRYGYTEECYFSFSYSPIYDESGGVGGVFCPVIETTGRVIGERRLRTLRDLAAQCRGARSAPWVCESLADVLAENDRDVPFALLYLVDDARPIARLASFAGIEPGAPAAPTEVDLTGDAGAWALGTVARSGKPLLLDDLGARFDALPTGAWSIPPQRVLVLPIVLPGQERPHAILVAAASPQRALDQDYRTFFELMATQIASGLADARALEAERRVARILESITDAFQVIDAHWRITYMNPVAKTFFARHGMDPDAMIGKHFWNDIFPDARDGEAARQMRRAMDERVPVSISSYHAPWDSWTLGRFDPLPDGGLANFFQDVTERKRADERILANEQRLAAGLAGMIRLQDLSTRLGGPGDSTPLLLDIVDAAIDLTDADMGNIQLVAPRSGDLRIEASRGFEASFLEFFRTMRHGEAACGTAMQCGTRLIVEDVEASPIFVGTPALPVMLAANARAVQSTPLFGRSGRLVGMLSTHYRTPRRPAAADLRVLDMLARQAADWIERTQAEEALRASEERFRRYFELGLVGMVITSPGKGCLEVNDRLCEMFGYERDEMLQLSWAELTHPDDLAADLAHFNAVLAGDYDGYTIDKRFIRKDGRVIDATISVNSVRRCDGTVDYFVALCDDITARKRTEAALRESEARFRSLISQVKDYAIFATDERGIVTTWNEGCQEVLGYAEDEFVGLDAAELYTAEDRAKGVPAADRRRAAETGSAKSDCWMVARGGRRFFAMGATTGLRDPGGRPIGYSTVLRDLTQMKIFLDELAHHGESLERLVTERTDELQKTTERLRLSERMAALGTLSAGLGHDMGNLLLPLDIRIRLLLDADLAPELRDHVIGIQTCAHYLQRLSSGLRLLAVDPWGTQADEVTEIAAWWDEVGMMLKSVLPSGVQFSHRLPPGDCWVAIGRVSLTQAVFNLVHNAADSMRERGAGRVTVSVQEDPLAGTVTVRIVDDGPGMSEAVVRRCMEPYFSTKTRGVSTGLGLPFVRGLVGRVGGRVEIESALDRGTTISLILPLARRADPASQADRVASVSMRDARMRSFIEGQLRILGFDVRRREKGEATALFVVDPPALAKLHDETFSRNPVIVVVGELVEACDGAVPGELIVLGRKPHADAICRALRDAAGAISLAHA